MHSKFRRWRAYVERIPHPALRIGIGLLLLAGGFLWFLPVLGIWMVPLGVAVLAIDIPWMRPIYRSMRRGIRRIVERMQKSNIGWIKRLGAGLSTPISARKQKNKRAVTPTESDSSGSAGTDAPAPVARERADD